MLKSILDLNGVKQLNNQELHSINGSGFCRCLNHVGSESDKINSARECSMFCTGSGWIYVGEESIQPED